MSYYVDEYRYVRRLITFSHKIDVWHEMEDNEGSRSLCGLDLDHDPFEEEKVEPYDEFQHQRGTGFPPGDVCDECDAAHRWFKRGMAGWISGSAKWEGSWPPPRHSEMQKLGGSRGPLPATPRR